MLAKHYGECSEMFVFLRKKWQETVQILKDYGASKILQIWEPDKNLLLLKGPWGMACYLAICDPISCDALFVHELVFP